MLLIIGSVYTLNPKEQINNNIQSSYCNGITNNLNTKGIGYSTMVNVPEGSTGIIKGNINPIPIPNDILIGLSILQGCR